MSTSKIELDTIHLGDCLAWLKTLPSESVDCVVSSPPYNIGKEYEVRVALAHYLDFQREVLAECVRVVKPTGSLFWQVGAYSLNGSLVPLDIRFFPMLEDLGMIPRNRIIWVKPHGLHAKNKFSARHETVLWFTKSDDYQFFLDEIRVPQKYQNKKAHRGDNKGELTCNPLGKNPGDIWLFQNVKHNHEEQTLHPAQFPEDMIARIVLCSTKPEDVVLDPFMGTGTVAVTARDLGRHYLGAEIDAGYHAIAEQRILGLPDENGVFPNLKTLRDYVARTGEPIGRFRFLAQTAAVPSERGKSKVFPENHHLEQMEIRLGIEEAAFAERIRGTGDGLPRLDTTTNPPSLFDEA